LNRSYKKGYRFEHRVKRFLERKGYVVYRLAGSKPFDLIAISGSNVYIIECKSNKRDVPKASERLANSVKDLIAKPLIIYKDKRNRLKIIDVRNNTEINKLPVAKG
jgi:Holliday junction resolvase